MKNKTITIGLMDGEKVGLTLTFGLLYELRENKKDEYEKYNEIVMNGIKDMMDYPKALYAAYLCKCIEDGVKPTMSQMEFTKKLPYAMSDIVKIYGELYNAGKKQLLGNPLNAEQGE